jgi:hypothetical protein
MGGDAGAAPPQQLLQTALVDPSGKPCMLPLKRCSAACWLGMRRGVESMGAGVAVGLDMVVLQAGCRLAAWQSPPPTHTHIHPHTPTHTTPYAHADPTKVYLTQPLDSSQQRNDAPKFPAPLV